MFFNFNYTPIFIFAIIGFISSIIGLISLIVWIYNHINIIIS